MKQKIIGHVIEGGIKEFGYIEVKEVKRNGRKKGGRKSKPSY